MFPLQDLLPPDTNTFYRYSGSLTTPTCNEVVTWTVFREPISISENQVSGIILYKKLQILTLIMMNIKGIEILFINDNDL